MLGPILACAAALFLATSSVCAQPREATPPRLKTRIERIAWTPALTRSLVQKMPKVEAHLHLDGALSPRTIQELAQTQGHAPLLGKSLREIRRLAVVEEPRENLAAVLDAFKTVYPLLRDPQALEKVALDLAESASRQNIRYMEVRFAPSLQAKEGFSAEEALKSVLAGLKKGEKRYKVKSGVIICLIRPFGFVSREQNEEMLRLAIQYLGQGVVGIDIAGNEAAQPLSDYEALFARAKQAGLRLTAHAGETPDSGDIETALKLGVDRLGHATLLASKPELLAEVKKRGIPIEVNLTSNLRTGAVKDLSAHPAREWYRAGIPITVSTDDPGVFSLRLAHEYLILSRHLEFSTRDLVNVSFQGVDSLFLPEDQREALRESFEREIGRILDGIEAGGKAGR